VACSSPGSCPARTKSSIPARVREICRLPAALPLADSGRHQVLDIPSTRDIPRCYCAYITQADYA
jgi:hypothetical protein